MFYISLFPQGTVNSSSSSSTGENSFFKFGTSSPSPSGSVSTSVGLEIQTCSCKSKLLTLTYLPCHKSSQSISSENCDDVGDGEECKVTCSAYMIENNLSDNERVYFY